MRRWIRPRPTSEEVDEWDRDAAATGRFYDLSGLPTPVRVVVVLVVTPFAAMAAMFAEIGYALHRVISRFASGG
jgi:hypothetical protein